jgi:hypothetical protein
MKLFTVREVAQKNIEVTRIEGQMDLLGIPFGQGPMHWMQSIPLGETAVLTVADIAPDGEGFRLLQEQRSGDNRALVLVETAAGVGGKIRLAADRQKEWYDETKRRVIRQNLPIEEAAGITVYADLESHFLVGMAAGASFRIMRNGGLFGAFPEFIVRWEGHWNEKQLEGLQTRMADFNERGKGKWPTEEEILKPWKFRMDGRWQRHGDVNTL